MYGAFHHISVPMKILILQIVKRNSEVLMAKEMGNFPSSNATYKNFPGSNAT